MLFQFLHNEKKCFAFINESQLKSTDILIVYILDCNNELGYELIFVPEEEAQWKTFFSIKNNYPATFNNICKGLEEIFCDQKFVKRNNGHSIH